MKSVRRALVAVSLLLCGACGSPSTVATSASSATGRPTPSSPAGPATPPTPAAEVDSEDNLRQLPESISGDRITRTIHLRPGQVDLLPAPADLPALALDQAAAYQAFLGTRLHSVAASNYPHTTVLGLLTNRGYGPVGRHGEILPVFVNYPSWFVIFHDIPDTVRPWAGATFRQRDATDVSQLGHVNTVVMLDALTGKYLLALDDSVDQGHRRSAGSGPGLAH